MKFVPIYPPNHGRNMLGRIKVGTSGVRKMGTFLQPCYYSWFLILPSFYLKFILLMQISVIYIFDIKQIVRINKKTHFRCNGAVLLSTTQYCQTLGLILRLRVDFALPLSQQEEQEQQPSPKSISGECTRRLKFDAQTTQALLAEFRG